MPNYTELAHADDLDIAGDELEAFEQALAAEEIGVEAPVAEAPAVAR